MAEVINLRDGSAEYVFDEPKEFLAKLILEKLGIDAARLFNDYVNELEDELKWAEEAQDEAEKTADEYLALCRDALDSLRELKELARDERLDKSKIQKLADRAYTNLNNNL